MLIGGEGIRARPLSLSSADYLRSKAAITLARKTAMEWIEKTLRAQGVQRLYVIAKRRENRLQTKAILGYGEQHGLQVCYSRTRLDQYNTGSGEATLRGLEHWNLCGPALVVPSDSVFNVDLGLMAQSHAVVDAAVTVATVLRSPEDAAGKYSRKPETGKARLLEISDDDSKRLSLRRPVHGAAS
jgi:NDP-sugar pyrophosphorylase family protein